jgi:hypothetical protein
VTVIAINLQVLRVFHGVDFNDEMQYYGEILALLETGKLFSSDMFLQQAVYVLFYPLLKLQYATFGTDSLILLGRIDFAAFIVWIYFRVRGALVEAGVALLAAALAALAVTLAIPLYNIYAISYNNVTLGILALCYAEAFLWQRESGRPSAAFWSTAVACLFVAYPPMGIAIAAVVWTRLVWERDWQRIRNFGTWFVASFAVAGLVLGQFATFAEYLEAIRFSREFSVGQTIFRTGLPTLAGLCCLLVAGLALTSGDAPEWVTDSAKRKTNATRYFIVALSLVAALDAVAHAVWFASVVCVVTAFALTAWPDGHDHRVTRTWTTVLFVVSVAVMAGTSSNGLKQIHGPAMLAGPFFVATALLGPVSGHGQPFFRRAGAEAFGPSLVLVFLAIYLANPYRDESIWHQNTSIDGAPAFRYLRVTPEKAAAINAARTMLSDIPRRSRLLVLGAHPWLYFATDTMPDTDMVFMHFTGGMGAYEILAARLEGRRPDFVVLSAVVTPNVRLAFEKIIRAGRYDCDAVVAPPSLRYAAVDLQTYYYMLPMLTLCRAPGRRVEG